MIRLLGIDLDGTLLDENKQISAANKQAIKDAKEKGVTVVITTGRPYGPAVKEFIAEIGCTTEDDYLITFNGALVYNIGTNEILSRTMLRGKDLNILENYASSLGYKSHYFKEDVLYIRDANQYSEYVQDTNKVKAIYGEYPKLNDDDEIVKYSIVGDPKEIKTLRKNLSPEIYANYSVFESYPFILEIVNKNVNKWRALKLLATKLGYSYDEIMTIGDAMNDYEMIEKAEIGVAMANAMDPVLKMAKHITASNNHSGVARAIWHYIMNRPYKILLVNDDGYDETGIRILKEELSPFGEITIIAPKKHHSGASVSFSPLHLGLEVLAEDTGVYSVSGTPVDCVTYGLLGFGSDFNLVVSGCNNGQNISYDTLYSGTIGACVEALIKGKAAIAFSTDEEHFSIVKNETKLVFAYILRYDLISKDYILNVNFPLKKFEKSVKIEVTSQYFKNDVYFYDKIDNRYYARRNEDFSSAPEGTDVYAACHGITSITPLQPSYFDERKVNILKDKVAKAKF